MTIRVAIVDDHYIAVQGVAYELSHHEDIEVVGHTFESSQVLALIQKTHPDVLCLDIHMPGLDPVAMVRHIGSLYPKIGVVILTAEANPASVMLLGQAGARGVVLKSDSFSQNLASAARTVYAGGNVFSPGIEKMMTTGSATAHFTSQELYLIRLLAAGYENAAIANFLNLSVSRVKSLVTEVYTKLGVQSGEGGILPRFAAMQKARLLGLLSEDLPGQASSPRP